MADDVRRYISIAALLAAGLAGAWTAWACHRTGNRGARASDAPVWAGVALVFLVFSQTKLAAVLGLLKGWGQWLRLLAREYGLYAGRRPYQITATVGVALIVLVSLVIGLVALRNYLRHYPLAIGFAALAVGFGVIRFISLTEVDAWNASMPWLRAAVELVAGAGASTLALARLHQLRKPADQASCAAADPT